MYTFSASTKQISHLSDVFQAVASVDPVALIVITPLGINLYGEHNHIINGGLSISPALFRTYNFYLNDSQNLTQTSGVDTSSAEELRLVIDIRAISECLVAMKLVKKTPLGCKYGSRLKLLVPDTYTLDVDSHLVPDRDLRSNNRHNHTSLLTQDHTSLPIHNNQTALTHETHDQEVPNNASNTNAIKDSDLNEKTCYITYNGDGNPFILEFEDTFITEKIEFLTHYVAEDDYSDRNNFLVNYGQIEWEMIVKSDVLANILKDMKSIGTNSVYMYVSNAITGLGGLNRRRKGPQIVNKEVYFISKGSLGNLKLIFPNEKTILERLEMYRWDDISESMVEANLSLTSHYNFQNFYKVFGSVSNSIKCKISKDLLGTLSVQMLSRNDELPNYPGTLVTFNILGLLDEVDVHSGDSVHDMSINVEFDQDLVYNYRKLNSEAGLLDEYRALEELEEQEEQEGLEEESRVNNHFDRELDDKETDNVVDIPLFL